MKSVKLLSLIIVSAVCFSCNKALVIKEVNYAQHVESVVAPDEQGIVADQRNNIRFSVAPLLHQEFGEDSTQEIEFVRILRNADGFYFITANNFKNVYVFEPKRGELKLKKSILIAEDGLNRPALNWRAPYIQIITYNAEQPFYIDENGIIKNQESTS